MMNAEQNAGTENSPKLFYRDGREFTGKILFDEKGKPFTTYFKNCSRCGGAGGSDKWKHTGWTCFECGGAKGHIAECKLYTAEKIAKMNAASDKRAAKKAAEREAADAARKAERDAARAGFIEQHKEFFATARTLEDSFVNDMLAQCIERVRISENQIELINNKLAEKARKDAAAYVGTEGERRQFTCTLENFKSFDTKFGTNYLHIMRDETGNTIKYLGSTILGNVRWERWDNDRYGDSYPAWDKAEKFTFTATVKGHEDYHGDKQTVVARPKMAEVK